MTMLPKKSLLALGSVLALGACASVPPSGPAVTVLPGSTKTFEQFRSDDIECRQFASSQIGGETPQRAANDTAVGNAAIGAGVGTVAGALIGGNSTGAAVGAGVGLIAGTASGAGNANVSARSLQQRYDTGYMQCMYAKGHKVPVSGRFESQPARTTTTPPPPPPPPGNPPPPPPGVKP